MLLESRLTVDLLHHRLRVAQAVGGAFGHDLVEAREVVAREFGPERGGILCEVRPARGARDRDDEFLLRENPRQGELARSDSFVLGRLTSSRFFRKFSPWKRGEFRR